MNRHDFFLMLKYFEIPFITKVYNQLFKYFDLSCEEAITKNAFCDRLNVLRDKRAAAIIDRFFELADPERAGWITKSKLRKFFRNNLTAKDQ